MLRKLVLMGTLLTLAACGGSENNTDDDEVALKPGELVITEVMVDSAADTNDDWVEIRNVADRPICVGGLRLRANLYDSGTFMVPGTNEDCIEPGGFYVFGAKDHDFVDFVNEKIKLPATKQEVLLLSGAQLIDSARYSAEDATAPLGKPKEGHSFSLCGYCQDAMCAKDAAHWILEESQMFNDTDYGTPGAATVCTNMPGDVLDQEIVLDCTAPAAGDLVITEVVANPFDEDNGEWLEVYVTESGTGKHLNGVDIVVDGKSRGLVDADACIPLVAGDYLVIAGSEFPFVTTEFAADAVVPSIKIPNKEATIALFVGEELLDEATYDEKSDGISWQLSGKYLDTDTNDDVLNWCFTTKDDANAIDHGDGDISYATPGAANAICPLVCVVGECVSGDECIPIAPLAAGEATITEVMANPHDEDSGEWFELRFGAEAANKHLNGIDIVVDGTAKGSIEPSDGSCVPATPDGYLVVAKDTTHFADTGIDNVVEVAKLGLKNDPVALVLKSGDDVVAQAAYAEKTDGISYQLNIYDIDAPELAENWCYTPATEDFLYASIEDKPSYGTPGAANTACPLVCDEGQCETGGQCVKFDPVKPGDLVITEVMADPGGDKGEWFELFVAASATGRHLNGLEVFVDNSAKGTVAGDGMCLVANGGDRLLVGKGKDLFATPYPVKADLLVSGLALKNGEFELRVEANNLIVDKMTYMSDDAGISYQLSNLFSTSGENDEPLNWCYTPATLDFEVEADSYATPGEPNTECNEVTP